MQFIALDVAKSDHPWFGEKDEGGDACVDERADGVSFAGAGGSHQKRVETVE